MSDKDAREEARKDQLGICEFISNSLTGRKHFDGNPHIYAKGICEKWKPIPASGLDEKHRFIQHCKDNPGYNNFSFTEIFTGVFENPFVQACWEGWQSKAAESQRTQAPSGPWMKDAPKDMATLQQTGNDRELKLREHNTEGMLGRHAGTQAPSERDEEIAAWRSLVPGCEEPDRLLELMQANATAHLHALAEIEELKSLAGTQAQAAQVCRNPLHYRTDGSLEPHEIGASCMAEPTESLLRKPGTLPEGCYCEPGKCGAPVIMGRQMSCRDPKKAVAPVAALEGKPDEKCNLPIQLSGLPHPSPCQLAKGHAGICNPSTYQNSGEQVNA